MKKNNTQDDDLFLKLQSLPGLPFHRAVSQDIQTLEQKREAFFQKDVVPSFIFPRAHNIDTAKYIEALKSLENEIELSTHTPTIKQLYNRKVQELRTRAWLIRAIIQQDDKTVTQLSEDLFGATAQTTDELLKELDEMLKHAETFFTHEKPIDAILFSVMIRKTLDAYDMKNWRIDFTERTSISIGHGFRQNKPVIYIPKTLHISKARTTRLLTHEIEVHALRTHNGMQSAFSLIERGLDRYMQTEEGLATYFQQQVMGHDHQHAPGFWDALSVSLTKTHGFYDVFYTLADAKTKMNKAMGREHAREKAKDTAWRLCARSYRGIADPSKPGVGFIRDHIYRSGNILIRDLISKKGMDIMPILFRGNIGIQHLSLIANLGLKPAKTPELIAPLIVKEVMS